jgi:organic hydroperoxide reductase OsmC/OhrA
VLGTVPRVPPRPKRTEYAVSVDAAGQVTSDGRAPLDVPERWTPEHVVLAGLASCVLTSLRYHAGRARVGYEAAASASGAVMLRDDGRWGFVDIECAVDLRIEPVPPALDELLAAAENGCFVGASLSPPPVYRWRVNGAAHSY